MEQAGTRYSDTNNKYNYKTPIKKAEKSNIVQDMPSLLLRRASEVEVRRCISYGVQESPNRGPMFRQIQHGSYIRGSKSPLQ
jgi:hypothetical protein